MKISAILLQSKDGFISKGDDDDLSWGSKEDKKFFKEVSTKIGNIIIGRKTFESMPEIVFNTRNWFVVSNTLKNSEKKNISFLSGNISDIISELKKRDIKEILVAGGSNIYLQFLESNLISEIFLTISPTILFNGIRGIPNSELLKFNIKEENLLESGERLIHYISKND